MGRATVLVLAAGACAFAGCDHFMETPSNEGEVSEHGERVAPGVPPGGGGVGMDRRMSGGPAAGLGQSTGSVSPPEAHETGIDRGAGAASDAVSAIAEARCEREERCGNVGVGAEHLDRPACLAEVEREWSDELSAYECPGGIARDELVECVEAIRDEGCGRPLGSLSRLVACRAGDICQAT